MGEISFFLFFGVFEDEAAWTIVTLPRLRQFNLFYDRSKFEWHGPSLRHILKLTCPLQELKLNADDMYFLTKTDLAPLPAMGTCSIQFQNHFSGQCEAIELCFDPAFYVRG